MSEEKEEEKEKTFGEAMEDHPIVYDSPSEIEFTDCGCGDSDSEIIASVTWTDAKDIEIRAVQPDSIRVDFLCPCWWCKLKRWVKWK